MKRFWACTPFGVSSAQKHEAKPDGFISTKKKAARKRLDFLVELAEISAKISVELRTFAVFAEWHLAAIQRNTFAG